MSILHLSRKWAWISMNAIGIDRQVSSLQDISNVLLIKYLAGIDVVFDNGFKKSYGRYFINSP